MDGLTLSRQGLSQYRLCQGNYPQKRRSSWFRAPKRGYCSSTCTASRTNAKLVYYWLDWSEKYRSKATIKKYNWVTIYADAQPAQARYLLLGWRKDYRGTIAPIPLEAWIGLGSCPVKQPSCRTNMARLGPEAQVKSIKTAIWVPRRAMVRCCLGKRIQQWLSQPK